MQPKRFFAENSQRAFRLVKESLGSEAVILSNRTLPNGVEIIAGDQLLQDASEDSTPIGLDGTDVNVQSKLDDAIFNNTSSNEEVIELKRLVMSELAAIKIASWEHQDKDRYKLIQYLIGMGMNVNLVAMLVTHLNENSPFDQKKEDVLQEIELSINTGNGFGTAVDELSGIVMVHGLTGAGKTTTIAKIAAQFVATHGKEEVVLVCADNKRMGARQQLMGYGKIMEIPVLPVRKAGELQEILTALKDKRLVLVDQAGITPNDLDDIESSPAFQCTLENVKHYLAVAATTQSTTLNKLFGAKWKSRLEGVIVTKVDEAVQLGELISSLIQNHVPATFISEGQDIQRDLQRLHPDELVNKAVRLSEKISLSQEDQISNTVKALLHKQLEFLH